MKGIPLSSELSSPAESRRKYVSIKYTKQQTPDIILIFNRHPVPFKCIIKPRSPAAEALIRDSVNEEG